MERVLGDPLGGVAIAPDRGGALGASLVAHSACLVRDREREPASLEDEGRRHAITGSHGIEVDSRGGRHKLGEGAVGGGPFHALLRHADLLQVVGVGGDPVDTDPLRIARVACGETVAALHHPRGMNPLERALVGYVAGPVGRAHVRRTPRGTGRCGPTGTDVASSRASSARIDADAHADADRANVNTTAAANLVMAADATGCTRRPRSIGGSTDRMSGPFKRGQRHRPASRCSFSFRPPDCRSCCSPSTSYRRLS